MPRLMFVTSFPDSDDSGHCSGHIPAVLERSREANLKPPLRLLRRFSTALRTSWLASQLPACPALANRRSIRHAKPGPIRSAGSYQRRLVGLHGSPTPPAAEAVITRPGRHRTSAARPRSRHSKGGSRNPLALVLEFW